MGQQQLLLLVLGAIIVGLAVVVGIQMFGESAVQANQDAILQDVVTFASKAQEWWRKPTVLGGGGRTFTTLTFAVLNMDSITANGTLSITGRTDTTLAVQGTGTEGVIVAVTVFPDSLSDPTITAP
jgi:hypothetical protein